METGKDLLKMIKGHPNKKNCPKCGVDVSTTALVDLVYTFEGCDCKKVPYKHLVETIWHRHCSEAPNP